MAFPAVAGTVTGTTGAAATNKVCNLPGSIAAGEVLLLVIRSAGADTHTTPGGWTDLVKNNSADASDDVTSIFYKEATGSEGASVTVNGTASTKFSALTWRISGAINAGTQAPEISTIVTGATTTPDPGTLTPAGGAKDYLWIWLATMDGESTSPPTGNPTGYSGPVGSSSGTSGLPATNCQCATAWKQANAASENPGSWTLSTTPTGWSAWVIAFAPDTAQTATPTQVTVAFTAMDPTVIEGVVTLAPTQVTVAMSVQDPTLTLGTITLQPTEASAAWTIQDPVVTYGGGGGPPPTRTLRTVRSNWRW